MYLCQYDLKRGKQYALVGVLFALFTAWLVPQEVFHYRIANGCFCSGVLLTAIGGLGFAAYLGGFDFFLYTHKKLSLYSKKNLDNPSLKDPGSYHDYLNAKNKTKSFLIPLVEGLLLLGLSFIISCF